MLAAFRTAVVALAFVATPLLAQDTGIAIGEKGPGGPLLTLDGKAVDLSSYIGKGPVLMEFWATWCPNCKHMEPSLRAAMQKYNGKVQFITVAVSINQSIERVNAWQKINKLPGVILYDKKGDVSANYDAPATSYVVVLDKTGKVVYTGVGGSQDVEAAVKKGM